MPIDSTYDARFRDRVLDAKAWDDTAIGLLEAARQLEPKVREFWTHPGSPRPWSDSWRGWADEFVAVYFMLSAFAIENFLKARIIRANHNRFRAEVDARRRLPAALRSHDLSRLAEQAGKPGLASGYAHILKRLTRSATWYGRYPAPTKPQGLDRFAESPDREPILLTSYSSDDLAEIARVLAELRPSHCR
jgi:hypothetical protein